MDDYLIQTKLFKNISLADPFFDSLKADYKEFGDWFLRKSDESAFIMEIGGRIEAFLYLKIEENEVSDVNPPLAAKRRLKVGTMKINPHGTRLGERFIKKIFDFAISEEVDEIYVTVFEKHQSLISLYEKYGFVRKSIKATANGEELVLIKSLSKTTGDILFDYPIVNMRGGDPYLLSIYPEFHTRLFPDSILNNETFDVLEDVSHTNSIHKIYVCFMSGVAHLKQGDILVIYRTKDDKGPARFRSVATSVCVVDEMKQKVDFRSEIDFVDYCKNYSVFSEDELRRWYNRKGNNVFTIKMTYNLAMQKRLTRGYLIDNVGLDPNAYWGIMQLSKSQFKDIVQAGGIDESFVIY